MLITFPRSSTPVSNVLTPRSIPIALPGRACRPGTVADGRVDVPVRTFPLPAVGDAWLAAAGRGHRVVVLP